MEKRNVLVIACGKSAIRFLPPLVLDKAGAEIGMKTLEEVCLKLNNMTSVP